MLKVQLWRNLALAMGRVGEGDRCFLEKSVTGSNFINQNQYGVSVDCIKGSSFTCPLILEHSFIWESKPMFKIP